MTPEELNDQLGEIIDARISALSGFSADSQVLIWQRIKTEIENLTRTPSGFIKLNAKNINTANRISVLAGKIIAPGSVNAELNEFNSGLELMMQLNLDYFQTEFGNISNDKIFKFTLEAAQENTLNSIQGKTFSNVITSSVKRIITSSIRDKKLFLDLAEELEKAIAGSRNGKNVSLGIIENHWVRNRVTRDSMFQMNANYHQAQASLTDGVWYQYLGPLVEDSREECIRRTGVRYFHAVEIEDNYGLGKKNIKQKWPEKIPNVSNFIQRGGYNCLHNLLLISERRVPKRRRDEVKLKYGV